MRPTNEQRIESLQTRRAQLEAELSQLRAQARQSARKMETRRKILIGAVILLETANNPKLSEWLYGLLRRRLTNERDLKLFGFSVTESDANKNKPTGNSD